MRLDLHFKTADITPMKYGGGSNVHTVPCTAFGYYKSGIRISFSPLDLEHMDVKRVIKNREVGKYGDSNDVYITIQPEELYSIDVRADRQMYGLSYAYALLKYMKASAPEDLKIFQQIEEYFKLKNFQWIPYGHPYF